MSERMQKLLVLTLAVVFTAMSIYGVMAIVNRSSLKPQGSPDAILLIPVGVKGVAASAPDESQLNALALSLLESFDLRITIGPKVELPTMLVRKKTGQMRADLALAELAQRTRRGQYYRVIGVTAADIAIPKYNFVFGLAHRGGRTCIASSARLGDTSTAEARVRLGKVALHVLGHTLRLMHSTDQASVMFYADSVDGLDATGPAFTDLDMKQILALNPELEGKLLSPAPVAEGPLTGISQ